MRIIRSEAAANAALAASRVDYATATRRAAVLELQAQRRAKAARRNRIACVGCFVCVIAAAALAHAPVIASLIH